MLEYQTRFCTSADGTRIGYAVFGDGKPFVLVPGWVGSEAEFRRPEMEEFLRIIGEGRQLAWMGRRGTDTSARDVGEITLDASVADVAAVVESMGAPVDLMGVGDGSVVAAVYAARYPDRVSRLILFSLFVDGRAFSPPGATESVVNLITKNWKLARRAIADIAFPKGPLEDQIWLGRLIDESVRPEVAASYVRFQATANVREELPRIETPTLVLHVADDRHIPISQGREAAALIPQARFVTLPGAPALPYLLPDQRPAREMRAFLDEGSARRAPAGEPTQPEPQGTAILLFVDIADSTSLTERLGDDAFRTASRSLDDRLRTVIRDAGGTPIEGKLLGDGILASFASARHAIGAARACSDVSAETELRLHVGLHAGDVIREDGNVFGGAVNIAARICEASAPGEILVSQTVRDLARTSAGVAFEDRGERALKGIADPVRVYAVRQEGD